MSLEMTFRQKLIRIGSAAAVCGLSFSFIVGEAVDNRAKELQSWTTDPYLVPEGYLPLQPVQQALLKLDTPAWRDNLVASNELPVVVPALEVAKNEIAPIEPAAKATRNEVQAGALDWLKTSSSAPVKFHASASKAPLAEKTALKREPDLKNTEVETILVSIHDATRKLMAQNAANSGENPVSVSNATKTKTGGSAAPQNVKPTDIYIEGDPKAAPPLVASTRAMREPPGADWSIQGRILSTTSRGMEPGHFEVGLFSKVDPENHPFGYQLSQKILPAGQTNFKLVVPGRIEKGYLFAQFVSAQTGKRTLVSPATNPWVRGNDRVAELFFRAADDVIGSVASAPQREIALEKWKLHGTVSTMFVPGAGTILQGDVVIKVRGRKESARSDRQGNFSLEIPRMKGTLFLEVLKSGYHPSIVSVAADDSRPLHIEIASRHAIDQISQRIGANQGSSHGVVVGQALSTDGAGLRGVTAQLSLKAEGPFYFDDEGVVSRELKATSGNGRFLFLNVESGTGYLETTMNGEPISPVQVSSVEGGELVHKAITPVSGSIKGRIFNPVTGGKLVPVVGARVRVDGASEWVTSDSYGAFSIGPMKWSKGERISLEVSAEKFSNHRYLVSAEQASGGGAGLNLFAFPAAYIARLARSMDVDLDPYSGLIIGKVTGPSLRMDALADHSTVNNARDFYFDSKGRLRGSHEMTDSRFGTYIIFNVPKGRALLQGNDGSGVLKYSDSVFANPSSINVQME